MVKRLAKIGLSLTIAVSSCFLTAPFAGAEKLASCTFEMQTNYKMAEAGEHFVMPLVNLTGQAAVWKSGDPEVAEVDANGRVIAKKEGNTVISAEVGDSYKKCYLTVNEKNTGINITEPYAVGRQVYGQSIQLHLETNNGIEPSQVKWSTSNKWCCTVDGNGKVTFGGSSGNCYSTITAEAEAGGKIYKDSCAIYAVKDDVGYYTLQHAFTKDETMNRENQLIQYRYFDEAAGEYRNYETYDVSTENKQWVTNEENKDYGYISNNSIAVGKDGGGAFAFRAPNDGVVNVALNSGKANSGLASDAYNYADVGIYRNEEQIYFCDVSELPEKYPPTISAKDGKQEGLDVSVQAGDYVYVRALMPKDATTERAVLKAWEEAFEFRFTRSDAECFITAPESLSVSAGESEKLGAAASKPDSTIRYMSTNENVATVDALGVVTAKPEAINQECLIYSVAEQQGNTYAGTVTVVRVNDDKLALNQDFVRIAKGESFILKGVLLAAESHEAVMNISPANEKIVSTAGNVITGQEVGTTYVTAEAEGKKAVCGVEVYDPRLYFEENFFELPNAGDSAVLSLKGTLSSGEVTYTKYHSQYAGNYTFDENTKQFTFGGNGYVGLVEVIASAKDGTGAEVKAAATFVVGGAGYSTDYTNQVTAEEIKGLPRQLGYGAEHYLWKYAFAKQNSTDYTLMPSVMGSTDGCHLRSENQGDKWQTGSFVMSNNFGATSWNPGRNGSIDSIRDAVLVFRAPKTGRVNISTKATPQISGGKMPFRVIYRGQVIYNYTFGENTQVFKDDFGTLNLDMVKGEEVLFTLGYLADGNYWACRNAVMEGGMFQVSYASTVEDAVEYSEITLVEGETFALDGSRGAISGNADIVAIKNNVLCAAGKGTAEVIAFDMEGRPSKKIKVTVKEIEVERAAVGNAVEIRVKPLDGGKVYVTVFEETDATKLKEVHTVNTHAQNMTNESVLLNEKGTVRIFFWDENMNPVCQTIELS